jgi:AcrR family transcriptional regulator
VAGDTRGRLLAAAERLFAEQGIDQVRLAEINRVAEVRNDSAVSYYFGSRQGLVAAILDRHHQEIGVVVAELGASRPSDGRSPRDAVEVLALSLAERLDSPSGRAYLRILGEVFNRGVAFPTIEQDDEDHPVRLEAVQEPVVAQLLEIERHLDGLPDALKAERLHRLSEFVVAAFASRARAEDAGHTPALSTEAFVRDLVDMATAAALATPSDAEDL